MSAIPLVAEDWQIADEDMARPLALIIQLRHRLHVLPYFRLVFAEGNDSCVIIAFASHLVKVNGHNLAHLLQAVADQRLIRLIEPTESEANFGVRGCHSSPATGPSITNIAVEQPE